MKKKEIIEVFSFLANGVKLKALADKTMRSEFIKFYRELRKIADPITKELNSTFEPPLGDASEEARKQILGEEVEEALPKISEECLLDALAESGSEAPVELILNVFAPFFPE